MRWLWPRGQGNLCLCSTQEYAILLPFLNHKTYTTAVFEPLGSFMSYGADFKDLLVERRDYADVGCDQPQRLEEVLPGHFVSCHRCREINTISEEGGTKV